MTALIRAVLTALLEVFFRRRDEQVKQSRIIKAERDEVHHDFEQNAREAEGAAAAELMDDRPDDLPDRLRREGL